MEGGIERWWAESGWVGGVGVMGGRGGDWWGAIQGTEG